MSPSDGDVTEPDQEPEKTEPAAGRNTVVIVSVAAVVVLAVAGVVIYLLTSGDDSGDQAGQAQEVPTITGSPAPTTPDPNSPSATVAPPATATGATGAPEAPNEVQGLKSVAEQAATAISSADVTTLNKLSCEPAGPDAEDTFPTDAKAEVAGEPKITGDTATIDLKLTIGESETTTVPMPLIKKDGRWCIPS